MRKGLLLGILLAFCLILVRLDSAHAWPWDTRQKPVYAGIQTLGVWNKESTYRLDISVWYPTYTKGETTQEEYFIAAARNAAPIEASYPVILVSHDMGSNRFAVHDLCSMLAAKGFIVIVPTHPKDNSFDATAIYTAQNIADRPHHLLQALEAALTLPYSKVAAHLDVQRIAVLGMGSGAVTALQLAGVAPQFEILLSFCRDTRLTDPSCSSWSQTQLLSIPAAAEALQKQSGDRTFTPDINATYFLAGNSTAPRNATDTAARQAVLPQSKVLRGVALLAPAWGMLFPAAANSPSVPVTAIIAGADSVYPPQWHAQPLLQNITTLQTHLTLADANHAALMAPCSAQVQRSLPSLCDNLPEEQGRNIRAMRDNFLLNFFNHVLTVD